LPSISKIAPGVRRNWLIRSEQGESTEIIAKDAGRDIRTVRGHIERSRLERDFEAAQREQLREALQAHQQDMMALLGRVRDAVHVPGLLFIDAVGLDYGLEDLWGPADLAKNRESALGLYLPSVANTREGNLSAIGSGSEWPIKLIRDASGPLELILTVEDSRIWRATKEHIGKDLLWRHISEWRIGLLIELQSRATLNRAIRRIFENDFGLSVGWMPGSQEPWLAPTAVWWMRARLTNLALGQYVPDLEEDIIERSPGTLVNMGQHTLTQNLGDTGCAKEQLQNTIANLAGCAEANAAAQSHISLREKTRRVHNALDEYLLIHHLPGRCRLCKKLGGQ